MHVLVFDADTSNVEVSRKQLVVDKLGVLERTEQELVEVASVFEK